MAATPTVLGRDSALAGLVHPRWSEPLGSATRLWWSNLGPGFPHGAIPDRRPNRTLHPGGLGQQPPTIPRLFAPSMPRGLGASLARFPSKGAIRNRAWRCLRSMDSRHDSALAHHAIPRRHQPGISLPHGSEHGWFNFLLYRGSFPGPFRRGRLPKHPLAFEPPKKHFGPIPALSVLVG